MPNFRREEQGRPSAEELAEHIVWNIESMAFPATVEEAAAFASIMALSRVIVTRPSKDLLLRMGMVPYNCHVNCSNYVASEPEGRSRHVWGWIISRSDLILHSIVERDGLLRCLTPQFIDVPSHFEFIPDPAIEWKDTMDGIAREPYRDGQRVPDALRKHPEDHIRMRDRFRELVDAGVSVMDARDMVATKFETVMANRTL
jgi:hypothetical protein